jgi:sulfonate transport system ATP-binding protein
MPWLTVKQNMGFPLISSSNRQEAEKTVDGYLDMLGLGEFRDAYPSQISGGMAQRAALGRTLCFDSELILMDEPLGALDAFNRRKLQNDLVEIFGKYSKTIVFVTHDVDEAIYLGQKIVVMDGGRILKEIPVDMPYPREPGSPEFTMLREEILALILNI